MNKTITKAFIMMLVLSFSIAVNVSAFADEANYSKDNIKNNEWPYMERREDIQYEHLKSLKILDENDRHLPESKVTRREVLDVLYTIYFATPYYMSYSDDNKCDTHWADVESGTNDAYLLEKNIFKLIKGRMDDDGKLYADLDKNVTYEETVLLVLRLLNGREVNENDENTVDYIIKERSKEYNSEISPVMAFAEECGLINYIAPYDSRVSYIPVINNKYITPVSEEYSCRKEIDFGSFVSIIDRMLYMPRYGGDHAKEPSYFIDWVTET